MTLTMRDRIDLIQRSFPAPNDVTDTVKAFDGWFNGMKNIVRLLGLHTAGDETDRKRFADMIITAWEFIVDKNFDISMRAIQPNYVGRQQNNLYQSMVTRDEAPGLDALKWLISNGVAPDLAGRIFVLRQNIFSDRRPLVRIRSAFESLHSR